MRLTGLNTSAEWAAAVTDAAPAADAAGARVSGEAVPAPGPDLRLLPAAIGAWACTWWATGQRAVVVLLGAALATGALLVLLFWLRLSGGSSGRSPAPAESEPEQSEPDVGPDVEPDRGIALAAVALVIAVVAVLLAGTGLRLLNRERDPLTGAAAAHATVRFTGRVVGDPAQLSTPSITGSDRWAVRIAVEQLRVRGRQVRSGQQLVALAPRPWDALVVGNRIRATARVTAGQAGDQEVALAFPRGSPTVIDQGEWIWRSAERLRAGLRQACTGLPTDARGLLPALVVGDTSRLDPRLRADLKGAGLSHLTAVSGANVAILAAVVVAVIGGLGGGIRSRVAGTALAIAGFVVLARPQPSVLRAAVMGGLALVGLLLARRGAGVPMLAATAVGLLFTNPWLARSYGFVLSVLATAGLLILVPLWLRRPHRLPQAVVIALAVPLAAQLVTAPVTVLLNPSISLIAVPANLLVEAAVAPATVAGVVAAALAPLWPTGAHLVAFAGGLATEWIALVAHRAAAVPDASLPWPAGLKGALLLAALTVGVVTFSLRRAWPALALCLVMVLGCLTAPRWVIMVTGGRWPPPDWVVVQCDVGQGSATLIRSGRDHAVLVDTGPDPALVDTCLRRTRTSRLDLVVITHFHADHAGGITGALHGRGSPPIIVSALAEPVDQERKVAAVAASRGRRPLIATVGMSGQAGDGGWAVRWTLLPSPTAGLGMHSGEDDGTRINNASVVLAATVQGLRVMALGDVEPESQRPLIRTILATQAPEAGPEAAVVDPTGQVLAPVDVVIVAHHGSARQEPRLYQLLRPRVALIGVGLGNDYGHPAPSALALMRQVGALTLRTDLQGQLAVAGSADRLRVATSG